MPELNQQIFELVESAPQQGIPKPAMAAIARRLSKVAQDLGQQEFYLLQDSWGRWWSPEISTDLNQPAKKWLVVFGNPSHATAMTQALDVFSDMSPPAEPSNDPSPASKFTVISKDVLPMLMLGLGLRNSFGLAVYQQEFAIKPGTDLPDPTHLIPTQTLQHLMKGALVDWKSQLKKSSTLA